MRILLAEDERPLARALVKLLEKHNCSADAVYNGEDALAYIEAGNYDAAVLDIMMPKLDGLTALRRLRASGNQIPVLLLTAKAEVDDRVLGLDSGANYYLTKPFDTKELLANKEFQMAEMLLSAPRQIISAERFMEKIWGFDSEAEINVVWTYISYLRKKLAALEADVTVKSVRNVGYSLEELT